MCATQYEVIVWMGTAPARSRSPQAVGGAEEMTQPCLTHRRAISLVAHRDGTETTQQQRQDGTKKMMQPLPDRPTRHLFRAEALDADAIKEMACR